MAPRKTSSNAQTQKQHRGYIAEPTADDLEQIEATREAFDGQPVASTRTRGGGVRRQVVFEDYGADSGDQSRVRTLNPREETSAMPTNNQKKKSARLSEDSAEPPSKRRRTGAAVPAWAQTGIDLGLAQVDATARPSVNVPGYTPSVVSGLTHQGEVPNLPRERSLPRFFRIEDDEPSTTTQLAPTERLRQMMRSRLPECQKMSQQDDGTNGLGMHIQYVACDGEWTMWALFASSDLLDQIERYLQVEEAESAAFTLQKTLMMPMTPQQEITLTVRISTKMITTREEGEKFTECEVWNDPADELLAIEGVKCQDGHMMWALLTNNAWMDELRKRAQLYQKLFLKAEFDDGLGSAPAYGYEDLEF